MGKRWPDKVRKHAMWSISSSGSPEVGVEIYEQLHKLLDIIQPHADTLWSLANDGATCMICCYLGSAAYEHMAIIDRGTMNRLLLVPGDLWLDVYGEEPEDLI
jgi:hypothetical protein